MTNRLPCGHIGRPSPRGCWVCRQEEKRANCNHAEHSVDPRWAGILGWRYYCGRCGERRWDLDDER